MERYGRPPGPHPAQGHAPSPLAEAISLVLMPSGAATRTAPYSPGYVEKLEDDLAQCRRELESLRKQMNLAQQAHKSDPSQTDLPAAGQASPAETEVELEKMRNVEKSLRTEIDTRMKTEQEIRELAELTNLIIDATDTGILLYKASGECIRANLAAARLVGATDEQMVRHNFRESRSWRMSGLFAAAEMALSTGETQKFDSPMRTIYGKDVWVVSYLSRVVMKGERYLLMVFTDIADYKNAEQALRVSDERYDLALRGSTDSIWDWNVLTNELYLSERWCETMGYRQAEIDSTFAAHESLLHPDDRDEVLARLRRHLEQREPYAVEFRKRAKNGEYRWFLIRGQAIWNERGQATRMAGSLTDITERKQVEQALVESCEALSDLSARAEARREEERKHIAREVHDELGQVLMVLRMEIARLKAKAGIHDAAIDAIAHNMLELVDRAIRGVRDVAGRLRPVMLDMGVVAAIEWQCKEFTEHSGIRCALEVADDLVELEESRAVAVFRIVQGSLTNIARHAAATRVDIAIAPCDGVLEVEVRDNGKGFHPETPFGKKSFGLLGMRERAIALGGEFNVTSRPGQGTVVTLRIPNHAIERRKPRDPSANRR